MHHRFANGLDLVAELHPSMKSTAVGFFVRAGSRDERDELWGVSHFLEHMAFKGRGDVSADDINRRFDEIGANYNASTSEEVTTYYAGVLPEYLPEAIDLLATLLRPDLRQEDFDLEKQVIIEEIGMYDDAPGFLTYEQLMAAHFGDHPLGRSILGSPESIRDLSREGMVDYHAQRYGAAAMTLVVAGNADWDAVCGLAERHCGDWASGDATRPTSEPPPSTRQAVMHRPTMLMQTLAFGAAAPPATSPHRVAAEVLSIIVGDDTGSRLYWEFIDPGFADTCELSFNEYDGAGLWMTYLACVPERAAELVDGVRTVYDRINRDGIEDDELERARNKLAARLVLGSERPMGRLGALGSHWVYRGREVTVDEELAEIRSVTQEAIRDLLDAYPLAMHSSAMIGPLEGLE